MSEEILNGESANAGDSSVDPKGPLDGVDANNMSANTAAGGSPKGEDEKKDIDLSDYVSKQDYEELGSKLSAQGTELGDYRQFYKDIAPLLDKIQDKPELAEAILEDKITSELLQAVVDGKVDSKTAQTVGNANEEVKKDLGVKKYSQASQEDIEKLITLKVNEIVENKVKGITNDVNTKLSKSDEKREFTDKTNEFIAEVADFQDYAEDIATWLEEHPSIYDIDVAYYAVKGKKTVDEAKVEADKKAVENDKSNAANASGGQSSNSGVITDTNIVDSLIASQVSPNS